METKKLDETKDSKEFWKTINSINGKKSGGASKPIIKENGNLNQNDLEKATTFAESLGKIHNTHTGEIFDDEFKNLIDKAIKEKSQLFSTPKENKVEDGDDSILLRDISIQEIKLQLDRTKGRSAPGADGIKSGARVHSAIILLIFKARKIFPSKAKLLDDEVITIPAQPLLKHQF